MEKQKKDILELGGALIFCLILFSLSLCVNVKAEKENVANVDEIKTTRQINEEILASAQPGQPFFYDLVDRIILLLEKESLRESLKKLSETHLYEFPGVLASSGAPREIADFKSIVGNRRFLKVFRELSSLPKAEAADILDIEIKETLKQYKVKFDKYLNDNSRTFEKNKSAKPGGHSGFIFAYYEKDQQGPNLMGLRYKMLALTLLAGNLNLNSSDSSVKTILETAIAQKDHFSNSKIFYKADGNAMLEYISLYNRRILGIAVLGTYIEKDKKRKQILKDLNLSMEAMEVTPYNSKLTPIERISHCPMDPVDYSKGKFNVTYLASLDDSQFEGVVKAVRKISK